MGITGSATQAAIADDFLRLASVTVRCKRASEAALRSAIRRAYYAVFLTARDHLFGADGSRLIGPKRKQLRKKFQQKAFREPGSHDLVIFAVTEVPRSAALKPIVLAQQVEQLKEARVYADYFYSTQKLRGVPYDNWRDYATKSVELASQLLPSARRLPPL